MKKNEVIRYCLAFVLNISILLTGFLYEGGIAIWLMFPPLQFLLNIVNYKWTRKTLSFLTLNLAMLVSSVTSIKISTLLYYNNISSDTETLAVGSFAVWFCVALIMLITLISVVCKIISKNSNK